MTAADFLSKLEELSERASCSDVLADDPEQGTAAYPAFVETNELLYDNRRAIADLVRAAERTCVKLMLDDEHELRAAVAALKGAE